jgi:hypothetical protein
MKFLSVWEPQILGATRIIVPLLYTQHGCRKLLGVPLREGQDFEFPEIASLRLLAFYARQLKAIILKVFLMRCRFAMGRLRPSAKSRKLKMFPIFINGLTVGLHAIPFLRGPAIWDYAMRHIQKWHASLAVLQ